MHDNKFFMTNEQIMARAREVHLTLVSTHSHLMENGRHRLYGIPRGGIPAAYAVMAQAPSLYEVVSHPMEATIFIDDILDSGATYTSWSTRYKKPFLALVDKRTQLDKQLGWVVFPWEANDEAKDEGVEDNIRRILQHVDPEPDREGIQDTPKRVAKAWNEWTSGYHVDISALMKTFEDGAQNYDEMVIVKDIPVYSKCEHHLADIFGTATVAYIPNGKVVGLSKISRVVNVYAKRLQTQERMTAQIADCLQSHLEPLGVGVIIKARHMCMESRGICQQGHHTITSALRGKMKDQPETRAEFMMLAK